MTRVIGGVTVPRLRGARALLLDALFPRFCVGCGREGGVLCLTCDETWAPDGGTVNVPLLFKEELGVVAASVSGAPPPTPPPRGGESFGSVWFLAHYADPVARGLLTTWKYHFDETAWATLARRLRPSLHLVHLRAAMAGIDAIVPVPLSRERKAERGFDQAERIAQWLAEGIHRPVLHLLNRAWTSGHQAERSTSERKMAMRTSPFSLSSRHKEGPYPQRLLLVDDVWTTGATMQAAARVLAHTGVSHIQPMTILKG